jgi:hypothetical protein
MPQEGFSPPIGPYFCQAKKNLCQLATRQKQQLIPTRSGRLPLLTNSQWHVNAPLSPTDSVLCPAYNAEFLL